MALQTDLQEAIDNAICELKEQWARDTDRILDRYFPPICAKVIESANSTKVQRQPIRYVIKYAVQLRKIGCSRPASALVAVQDGDLAGTGTPFQPLPLSGPGGSSKRLVLSTIWGVGRHALHAADWVTFSSSHKFPAAPLRPLGLPIQFDGGGTFTFIATLIIPYTPSPSNSYKSQHDSGCDVSNMVHSSPSLSAVLLHIHTRRFTTHLP
ncbi:hypothetical protein Fcan01_11286 [Folsomia candida]|uniref:Uncharacterized protein n=1 Tax=Folsomia candida TaxID=158441 RepID=A0A226E7Z8_FOLCA|nr:hypothetical protein Fcan01_11286 [Folsomia candida]